jgi:hypothetical protein
MRLATCNISTLNVSGTASIKMPPQSVFQRDYYGYDHSSSRCPTYAFNDTGTQLAVAIPAVDFLLVSIVAILWLVTSRKIVYARRILRWYNLGLYLLLYLVYVPFTSPSQVANLVIQRVSDWLS